MNLPSTCTKAFIKTPFVSLAMIAVLMIWAADTLAYENYADGCDNCHGDFTDSPYTSLSDGASWGNSLHNVHRTDMLADDCDVCHTGQSFKPVLLESSNGGTGLAAIGCVGCHGRDEDNGNSTTSGTSQRGAGLRQHHVGFATCSGCHDDQTGYTPVGENILPNYYANPGTGHPAMPTDSCNPSGGENFAGTALGLDNDGNGVYDTGDSACGIASTYSVGGSVSGLTGTGLALQNNGADTLAIAADGPFTFATALADGSAYAVTVSAQPAGQTCSVSNGSGTIAAANVTNVAVTCITDVVPTYSVGGSVSGLTGTGLALQNNGSDTLAIAADGPFTFATALADGSAYAVTVSAQPAGQTCSVSNGSGTIAAANVTNVAVTCIADVSPTYSVGGNVTGLTGTGLALQNNGTDTLAIAGDGPFTFATELTDGSAYAVTVSSQPVRYFCTVSNGSGTIAAANVTDVAVTCILNVGPPIPPRNLEGIPTLSRWALILLTMILGWLVFTNRKRLF